MTSNSRDTKGSVRVFQSDFLERFTHVHPLTPLLLWTPILVFLLWRSFAVHTLGFFSVLGVGFIALFLWTLTEYMLHRWVFHYVGESQISRRLQFMIHGLHHDDPQDATRLVMPPVGSIILGVIFYSTFRFLLGQVWADPFFAFFVVGYLCYDYAHYSVHHFRPRTRFGKMLKQNHMNHHYKSPESLWGVSSPIWDYVFGTTEPASEGSHAPVRHGS
jgi:sterol desaturase/sphingolipid hydroxylase (fatty acid hydroxylase superfamily)